MSPPRLGSLFSGFGGLDLAIHRVLDAETAFHVENDPHAARVLNAHWPGTPNLGDIEVVDWSAVEPVEVLAGGFPCQDLSYAGHRKGLADGTRSGLWSRMAAAIQALRPSLVVIENVRGILSAKADSDVEPCPSCLGEAGDRPSLRALGVVLGDLADLRYDTRWIGLRASDAGAPHQRYRIFIAGIRRDGDAGAAADTGSLHQGVPQPARRVEEVRREHDGRLGLDAPHPPRHRGAYSSAGEGEAAADPDRPRRPGPGSETHRRTLADRGRTPHPARINESLVVEDLCRVWGPYAAAIGRWEQILGRPAPHPYEVRDDGGRRLNPKLVEFLMGLTEGHVTDLDLSYRTMLRILGNGVVPQQAELALRTLLADHAAGQEA